SDLRIAIEQLRRSQSAQRADECPETIGVWPVERRRRSRFGPGTEEQTQNAVMEHIGEPRERHIAIIALAIEHVLGEVPRKWSVRPEHAQKVDRHPITATEVATFVAGDRRRRKLERRLLTQPNRVFRNAGRPSQTRLVGPGT